MTTRRDLFAYLRQHCRDEANVTPLPVIAAALGTTTRQVQALLEECAGMDGPDVVCSRTGRNPGLFITRDPEQIRPYLIQLRNRERNTRRHRLPIEAKYPQLRENRLGRPPLLIVSNGPCLRAQTNLFDAATT